MTPLTAEELAAIKLRAEKATEGQWSVVSRGSASDVVLGIESSCGESIVETDCGIYPPFLQDAEFIAHARQDIPRMLATIEALEEDNHRFRVVATNALSSNTQGRDAVIEAKDAEIERLRKMLKEVHDELKRLHPSTGWERP